jgi:hypothetical protein
VIVPGSFTVPTLWAEMDFRATEPARQTLTEREWLRGDPQTVVGLWSHVASEQSLQADRISEWAATKGLHGVVWTKLPAQFEGKLRVPSAEEVLRYLRSLSGRSQESAEEYVRRAPRQVATPYRDVIERALGWTYNGSLTDANISQDD